MALCSVHQFDVQNRGRRPTLATHLPASSPGLQSLTPTILIFSLLHSLPLLHSPLFWPCSCFERTHIDGRSHTDVYFGAGASHPKSSIGSTSPALHVHPPFLACSALRLHSVHTLLPPSLLPSFPPSLLPLLPSFPPSLLPPSLLPPSLLPSFPPSLLPSFPPSLLPSFPSFIRIPSVSPYTITQ
ncbi:hypothetical protein B0H14DRAFT_3495411 [Mycena olivaceomarginata]|nr:hypothetical protein B0H14DRAFT_3495411 [Mycena olivaceomarginata]